MAERRLVVAERIDRAILLLRGHRGARGSTPSPILLRQTARDIGLTIEEFMAGPQG